MSRRSRSLPQANKPIKGRVVERHQGCWNCKHWDHVGDLTKQQWKASENRDLGQAAMVAAIDPRGAGAPKVVQIEKAVAGGRNAVQSGKFRLCLVGGAQGFVEDAFLCTKWDAKQGASIARGGGFLDPLPDEVKDKIDG